MYSLVGQPRVVDLTKETSSVVDLTRVPDSPVESSPVESSPVTILVCICYNIVFRYQAVQLTLVQLKSICRPF